MSAATATEAETEGAVPSLAVEGARATIRLNRPRHMNRIQPEDIPVLMRLLDAVDALLLKPVPVTVEIGDRQRDERDRQHVHREDAVP